MSLRPSPYSPLAVALLLLVLGGCHHRSRPETKPEPTPDPVEVAPPVPRPLPPTPRPTPTPEPRPTPSLLPSEGAGPDEPAIRARLTEAGRLLALLEQRSLAEAQLEQADAARAFVAEAREALQGGELQRAATLADKSLLLARELENVTRR